MEYSAAQPRGVGRMGDDIEVGGLLRSTAGPADDMAHASRSIQDPVAQGISIGARGIHAVAGWPGSRAGLTGSSSCGVY